MLLKYLGQCFSTCATVCTSADDKHGADKCE